jgi:hypothetical protein
MTFEYTPLEESLFVRFAKELRVLVDLIDSEPLDFGTQALNFFITFSIKHY